MTDSVTEAIRRTQEAIERDGVNMSDLVERLKRVQNPDYPECQQAADEIGRLQPDWVDRRRSLGNAIVPQIAEIIGSGIMHISALTSSAQDKS